MSTSFELRSLNFVYIETSYVYNVHESDVKHKSHITKRLQAEFKLCRRNFYIKFYSILHGFQTFHNALFLSELLLMLCVCTCVSFFCEFQSFNHSFVDPIWSGRSKINAGFSFLVDEFFPLVSRIHQSEKKNERFNTQSLNYMRCCNINLLKHFKWR